MVARERAEWEGRVGWFAGKKAAIGDVWEVESDFALPTGGTIKYRTKIEFAERVSVAGRECVRVRYTYDTGPGSAMRVEGGGERVVDPATMLIYSETLERTMHTPQARQRETRAYRHEYAR